MPQDYREYNLEKKFEEEIIQGIQVNGRTITIPQSAHKLVTKKQPIRNFTICEYCFHIREQGGRMVYSNKLNEGEFDQLVDFLESNFTRIR